MQIELKEAYEELKEMYGEENIISAVIHGETTPHLCDFCAVDQSRRSIGEDVIGDKKRKCAGRKRNFLKQCKKGASR